MFNTWSRFSLIVNWSHYNKSSILYYIDKTKGKISNKIISEFSKKKLVFKLSESDSLNTSFPSMIANLVFSPSQ